MGGTRGEEEDEEDRDSSELCFIVCFLQAGSPSKHRVHRGSTLQYREDCRTSELWRMLLKSKLILPPLRARLVKPSRFHSAVLESSCGSMNGNAPPPPPTPPATDS